MDIEKRKPESELGAIKDIHFSDISINSQDGHCLFLGQPDSHLDNITFSNIQFTIHKHISFEGYKKPRGNRSLINRAANDYSHIPANFTFAFADNIMFDGLTIIDADADTQPSVEKHMIWGYELHSAQIKEYTIWQEQANKEGAQFVFKDASDIQLSSGKPAASDAPLLRLEGAATKNVVLMNNRLLGIPHILESGDGFDSSEFIDFNNLKETK
jgi:hypothetical protein